MKGVPEVQAFMYHPYWTARPPIHVSPSAGSTAPVRQYQQQSFPPQPYVPYVVDPIYGFGGDIEQHHYHHEASESLGCSL
uniref:DAZ-associated protein 2 n=1 Tax=Bursaphelenchus xylophilus TaxID=6326 RepID=A0A1I7SJV6_BURXY